MLSTKYLNYPMIDRWGKNSLYYISIFLTFFCITITGCDKSVDAPEVNYYFKFETKQNKPVVRKIISFLETELPKQKYAITNQSGRKWPYYQAFDIQEKVHLDSLMPPHRFLHRMVPLSSSVKTKNDDYVVLFSILPQPDTIFNYQVEIFYQESNLLQKSGDSGIHFMDTLNTNQPWIIELKKSIIRYSFK